MGHQATRVRKTLEHGNRGQVAAHREVRYTLRHGRRIEQRRRELNEPLWLRLDAHVELALEILATSYFHNPKVDVSRPSRAGDCV